MILILALTFALFSGILGSFELVRYTGDGSVTHRQVFEYIHIDQNRDRIGINRLLEVKNALDDEYVYVDRLNDEVLQENS